jgi:beta-phosphoglucomutase
MKNKLNLCFLFDVDGVIAETPHQEAWMDAAVEWGIIGKNFDFTGFYTSHVAGEPGMTGALNILEFLHEDGKPAQFRDPVKQKILEEYIDKGQFKVFEDASKFVFGLKKAGYPLAVVSSSENARRILEKINPDILAKKLGYSRVTDRSKFIELFDAEALGTIHHWHKKHIEKVSHYAMAYGKLLGAKGYGSSTAIPIPIVFEDAPKGVVAVKKLGFYAVGISRVSATGVRLASPVDLRIAGADLVYDEMAIRDLDVDHLLSDLEEVLS